MHHLVHLNLIIQHFTFVTFNSTVSEVVTNSLRTPVLPGPFPEQNNLGGFRAQYQHLQTQITIHFR